MVVELTKYYKDKGYVKGYLLVNKEPRRLIVLVHDDGIKKTMSYARYLYSSYIGSDIPHEMEVDHINNDKMDDRIENYQLLSKAENIRKNHPKKELVQMQCPICGKHFLFEKRNLSSRPNPCCSRTCGGKKSQRRIKR